MLPSQSLKVTVKVSAFVAVPPSAPVVTSEVGALLVPPSPLIGSDDARIPSKDIMEKHSSSDMTTASSFLLAEIMLDITVFFIFLILISLYTELLDNKFKPVKARRAQNVNASPHTYITEK